MAQHKGMLNINFYCLSTVIMAFGLLQVISVDLKPPDYDKHIAPKAPDGGPVTIHMSAAIYSVNEVNEKDMELVFSVFFRTSWTDHRLQVPEGLFNESTESVVLSQAFMDDIDIWLPDPYIGKVKEIQTASMLQPFAGVRLYRNGKLLWSQMFIITLSCPMFFQDFPFDTQTCSIEIGSYFYGIRDIMFAWLDDGITTSEDIPSLLGDYEFEFYMENTTTCTVPEYVNGKYPCLRSYMSFKRRYKNHLIGAYFPSLLFVGVAWASFFWPPAAVPARTVLLITCLLTTISLYSSVQSVTPAANYTRAIDIWFFACILAVALALFQYSILLQIRARQKQHSSGNVNIKQNTVGTMMANLNENESSADFWFKAEKRVELGARISYVIIFVIFNALYWSIYL